MFVQERRWLSTLSSTVEALSAPSMVTGSLFYELHEPVVSSRVCCSHHPELIPLFADGRIKPIHVHNGNSK
ncbi:hypothetical protein YC2023_025560 [Brassica napus]